MRALRLEEEQKLKVVEIDPPPPPSAGEVQVRIRAVALNHIDVWGWRGMAFARRELPIVIGAEAAGELVAVGAEVEGRHEGELVALYGAQTCASCRSCREGRDNLCDNVRGIYGFHIDGFAQEKINIPARLAVPVPSGLDHVAAACAPVTFGTVEHMLFDNAKLRRGETILIHAGGSGIGTAAIQLAKVAGATVITTVGSEEKKHKVLDLGADHAINYQKDRFEGVVRKLTRKKGVDVVFEHVGAETWAGSLFSLGKGGRLVTCGSTSGIEAQTNLFHLFQQQLRIYGSFGCSLQNIKNVMEKLADGTVRPIVDRMVALDEVGASLERLANRQVFGKFMVTV